MHEDRQGVESSLPPHQCCVIARWQGGGVA